MALPAVTTPAARGVTPAASALTPAGAGVTRAERVLGRLPRGNGPDDRAWDARHRGIVRLLWLHTVVLPLLSLAFGDSLWHALTHGAALAVPALLATRLPGRLPCAVMASFGLLTASALLVHATGGLTEAHFHFFVMISVVTLYEDWRTFLLAFAYVVGHHGLLGTLMPEDVFDHAGTTVAPWIWVAIHGGFVLAAGVANVVAWRANETATERRTRGARDRAEDAQLRLAALVESTDDAVIGKTPAGTITSWNAGAERLFGRTTEEMVGASIMAIVPEEHRDEERELMARVVEEGRLDHFETTRLHADGRAVEVSLTLSCVRDVGAGDIGLVGIARDITDRKRLERQREAEAATLQELAHADHLTGLGNRRRFDDALAAEIARCGGQGDEFALMMFDLDGFKGVNDELGHAEGDRVLVLLADLMRAAQRSSDIACRLGGDEFALILPRTDRAGAIVVGERIRAALRDHRADVDVSFGIALWPVDAVDKNDLVARADTGMYSTKALRRTSGRREEDYSGRSDLDVGAHAAVTRLLHIARDHMDIDVTLLGGVDDGHEVTACVSVDGEAFGIAADDRVPLDATSCRPVIDGRLPNATHGAVHDERDADLPMTAQAAGAGTCVDVPLNLPGGELYGVLCCLRKDSLRSLDQRDVRLLQMLATIAGEQLERSRLERPAERLRQESTGIEALLSALEARDHYTGQHSTTVVSLAERVAQHLGLDEWQVTEVRQAALLHDIGKIGIPDVILRKAAPLDDEEWLVMRHHPAVGAEILAAVPTLAHLAPTVRAEHECWDGSGYPDGLAGERIPLASRITFACDAYDAMTSDRPYRAAMPPRHARRELEAHAGTQFDPEVVAALLDILDREAPGVPVEAVRAEPHVLTG